MNWVQYCYAYSKRLTLCFCDSVFKSKVHVLSFFLLVFPFIIFYTWKIEVELIYIVVLVSHIQQRIYICICVCIYICIHIFFIPFSIMVYYKILNIVHPQFLVVTQSQNTWQQWCVEPTHASSHKPIFTIQNSGN